MPALLLRQSLSAVIIFLIFILFGQPTVFFHTVKQSTVTHTNHSQSTQSAIFSLHCSNICLFFYHYTFSIFGKGNISLAPGFAFLLKGKDLAEKSHTPPRISGYPQRGVTKAQMGFCTYFRLQDCCN